jgi:MYXO-CTERM domain-containing protein
MNTVRQVLMMFALAFSFEAMADRAPPVPPVSAPASKASETVKEPAPPAASGPAAKADAPKVEAKTDAPKPADTKTGGCAVDPAANAGLLTGLMALGLVLRRRRSGR